MMACQGIPFEERLAADGDLIWVREIERQGLPRNGFPKMDGSTNEMLNMPFAFRYMSQGNEVET